MCSCFYGWVQVDPLNKVFGGGCWYPRTELAESPILGTACAEGACYLTEDVANYR